MITIFSCPKAMAGYTGIIQKRAILSWKKNISNCTIILFGNEEGVASFSHEWDIQNVEKVDVNEFGTPLLSSMFNTVQMLSRSEYYCYVNSDIIICGGLLETVRNVRSKFDRFLVVGRRYDIDPRIDRRFGNSTEVCDYRGFLSTLPIGSVFQIDYFIYTDGDFSNLPPFAIGRPAWDNWMIRHAKNDLRIPVIDATSSITAIHQKHDYDHVPKGRENSWEGPEGDINRELAGGDPFCTLNADYRLNNSKLRRAYVQNFRYYFWLFQYRLRRLQYLIQNMFT